MKIKLNISDEEREKFHSNSGLATRAWGPLGWGFLFSCITNYPIRIKTAKDKKTKTVFKSLFKNLNVLLPCIFCRESFGKFYKELPIEPYLVGRIELMYWLYLMKDKVNKKLIKQERKCYNKEKKDLKRLYYNKEITHEEYYSRVNKFKENTMITKHSPTFIEVLQQYEEFRATCSKRAKTCAIQIKYT